LRVDITLIQRFSDPEISNLRSCSKILNCSSRMQTGAHKAMTNFEAILGWEGERIFLVLILTNNQMEKHFLRTSSRVLRGSQILKSSIIADENNLEAQRSRRRIPHEVQ
jgi:hypothetical protein